MVLPADKGNVTIIIDLSKMGQPLQDQAYKQIKIDPTTYFENTTKSDYVICIYADIK